jgi:hypothetical protein
MSGNLVLLGLGVANAFKPGGPNLVRVGIVIAAFARDGTSDCRCRPIAAMRWRAICAVDGRQALWAPGVRAGSGAASSGDLGRGPADWWQRQPSGQGSALS